MASEEASAAISVSDSDGEQEVPTREECESRCQQFAEVTGTDTALAMFYLQERDWDVERSINDYFHTEQQGSSEDTTTQVTIAPPVQQIQTGFKLLSWNIDGLDPDNIESRAQGVCSVCLQENPDVIFLQEVVERNLNIIKSKCPHYHVYIGADGDGATPVRCNAYFTAILLRKDSSSIQSVNRADFPGSLMERNLLEVKAKVKGIPVTFLTSHLESTAEHSQERRRQLKSCFSRMLAESTDRTVIFGGDLNLREKELSGDSAKPAKVYDIWECTGKRPEAKHTWDLLRNDNKQFGSKFSPRCRFDRLYVRHSDPVRLKPVYFELVGIQRLASCQRFPSDHWGILAHFNT